MEIDFDACSRRAPTARPRPPTSATALINDCFIPQIVFSTTFGYRTDVAEWNGKVPEDLCAVFDLENFPGKRALEKRPKKNLEWALLCDGVAKEELYDVLSTAGGRATGRSPSSTPSRTRSSGGRPAPRRRSSSPTRRS